MTIMNRFKIKLTKIMFSLMNKNVTRMKILPCQKVFWGRGRGKKSKKLNKAYRVSLKKKIRRYRCPWKRLKMIFKFRPKITRVTTRFSFKNTMWLKDITKI